jgi:hypothetical protein
MLGLLVRECVLAYDMQPFHAIGRLFNELREYAASDEYERPLIGRILPYRL